MNKFPQRLAICLGAVAAVGLLVPFRGNSATPPEDPETHQIREMTPLGPMLGKQVLVVGKGIQQEGRLETYDSQWLRIRTKDGQRECYSAANLILVKLEETKP